MNQTYQQSGDTGKPFQGLRNLSVICSILGYLSFLGGFVMASMTSHNAYNSYDDPVLPFVLWFSVGFVGGIGYLIIADVLKLFVSAKENLDELLISAREIATHLREAREK